MFGLIAPFAGALIGIILGVLYWYFFAPSSFKDINNLVAILGVFGIVGALARTL